MLRRNEELPIKFILPFLCIALILFVGTMTLFPTPSESFYSFQAKDIDLNTVSFSRFKNKVVLIVNVASKCGYTEENYKQLPILDRKYRSKGLEIIAFPCNQFGFQESGTNQEIKELAKTYGVNFLLMDKIEVNGPDAHPLWKFLKKQTGGTEINWNFSKFLITKNGVVYFKYDPATSPFKIEPDVENLLKDSTI